MSDVRIIVFAKAPVPGLVKTRLASRLGAAGAAALHARLVERTLATAATSGVGPLELHCAPDITHPFFAACATRHGAALFAQTGHDLGDRMYAACRDRLPGIIVGSDCAALTADHLRQASNRLKNREDAVFIPTEDGGYALLGLTRTDPALFDRIPWGTETVMARTRERLHALGWRWVELETLWDIDRPEDYDRLAQSGLDTAGTTHA